jgi:CheY-like chemotaxis protein
MVTANLPSRPEADQDFCQSVLIVEDDDYIRDALELALKSEGYIVGTAPDGQQAIDLLPTMPQPSLILLDMNMPVMSGWQFLQAQKASAQFADLPVVILSAVPAGQVLVSETGAVSAEGMLSKPIHLDHLFKVVGQYCANRTETCAEFQGIE